MPILDKEDLEKKEQLKKFLKNSEYANFYQSFEWANIKSDKWDNAFVYLEENKKIIGVALVLIRKLAKGFTIMYIPRGPVVDSYNIDLIKKLLNEMNPLIKKYKPFVVKFDPEVTYDEKLEKLYLKNGFRVKSDFKDILELMRPIRSMVLNIKNKTKDEIISEYGQKTRYNIKVAIKNNVKVRYSREEEDLKKFYELMLITAKRDDIAVRSYNYFKKIIEEFKDNSRIYLSEHNGKCLAAAIAVNYGKCVTYFYGGSSNEDRNLMPCYIMQQNMINWALETECTKYDFGGIFNVTKDNGLYRFKAGFCKKDGPTKYIGEIDKVYNPIKYYIFCNILPKIKKLIMKIN